jgi:hypothetical protein
MEGITAAIPRFKPFVLFIRKDRWRLSEKGKRLYKILGFHGGDYEEWRLLGYYALWLL